MRIILYIMDGVSARKVRSYNSDEVNDAINQNVPLTYLDELYKKGFSAKYCYGFDNTQSSFYTFMTGKEHYHSSISVARNSNLLDYDRKKIIPSLFQKKGFKTHYFSNNCVINPGIILEGYEKQIYDFENYDLSDLHITENFDELFGINTKDNIFLTIHDFYTHDQNGQYSQGKYSLTTEEYEKLIINHADKLKNNLDAIKFNPDEDYLFLISDHGLTVDTSVFKDKGDDESLWSLNSKELKARVMCNIIGPDIKSFEFNNICTLRELFYTFVDKFDLNKSLNNPELNLLNKPNQKNIFSINSGNAAVVQPSRTTFHQFMCVTNNNKKYIYQDNLDKNVEYYELSKDITESKPILKDFNDLPLNFKNYIEKYQTSREWSSKMIISYLQQYLNKNHILYVLRNYKKIPNKIMKIIGVK